MTQLTHEFSKKVDDMNKAFNQRMLLLEEELGNVKRISRHSIDADDIEAKVLDEVQNIESRRKNVIIFGLAESDAASQSGRKSDDSKRVSDLATDAGISNFQVRDCYRLGAKVSAGKPRPLKLLGLNNEVKTQFLRKARRISEISNDSNFGRIFIKNDLTPRQQERERELLAELRARRLRGENVFLRRGKIVHSASSSNQ